MLLNLHERVVSSLRGLPPKQFRQVVNKMFELMTNPRPHDSCDLVGSSYRRVDVGEYRICYQIVNEVVRVVIVGKRNDNEVYRLLKRLS